MANFCYELDQFVQLNCGCRLDDDSGELYDECIPHKQSYFMQ